MGWTVVGLAFVAGASGAAFNHFYTGDLDKDTRQKYTAVVTFGYDVVISQPHTTSACCNIHTYTLALHRA